MEPALQLIGHESGAEPDILGSDSDGAGNGAPKVYFQTGKLASAAGRTPLSKTPPSPKGLK